MTTGSITASRDVREFVWTSCIRWVACSLIAILTLQGTVAAARQEPTRQEQAPAPASQSQTPPTQQAMSAPPMMPANTSSDTDLNSLPSAPTPQSPAREQQAPAQQQATPQEPVGTAAAPYEKPTGVPGSSPAGAVIAPAKQRRVRAIAIRVGIVIAAGAAVGAVVGLSRASHSSP